MNDQVTLRVLNREGAGKGVARRLRRQGLVPANIYGRDEESVSIQVDRRELELLLDRISVENTLIDLEMETGEARRVLIREVQKHPWKSEVLHVDFLQIQRDVKLRVGVPVRLVGTPVGVRNEGGILQQSRHELEVECLPREIPEQFEVDVSDLAIGDSIHVADLNTGGVRPLEELDVTICTVLAPTVVAVEAEEEEEIEGLEEGELEPEVIGKSGSEEDTEEESA